MLGINWFRWEISKWRVPGSDFSDGCANYHWHCYRRSYGRHCLCKNGATTEEFGWNEIQPESRGMPARLEAVPTISHMRCEWIACCRFKGSRLLVRRAIVSKWSNEIRPSSIDIETLNILQHSRGRIVAAIPTYFEIGKWWKAFPNIPASCLPCHQCQQPVIWPIRQGFVGEKVWIYLWI